MSRTIQAQVNKTYFSLRWAAAIIGYAFGVVLYVGGLLNGFGHVMGARPLESMSSYYHGYYHSASNYSLEPNKTPCDKVTADVPCEKATASTKHPDPVPETGTMRDWFVGMLFAIGAVLYVNKGHTDKENILLNLAGIFACGIALFPMPWSCEPKGPITPHGTFAILFFFAIASILIFCSKDTVECLPQDKRGRYYTWYYSLAGVMIGSPLLAGALNEGILGSRSYTFAIEFVGIYAFGTYWVVKTREIKHIQRHQAIVKVPRPAHAIKLGEPTEAPSPNSEFY